MVKKILILPLFFYVLTLFQNSFLVHFNIAGLIPNFVLISIILISFISTKAGFRPPFLSAFLGGFFLDIFSTNFIGIYVLISLGLVIFIKIILRRYVRA